MDWDIFLENEFKKDYYIKLKEFIDKEYETSTCFPPKELIFNAFNLTKPSDIKVVILGQDPYHEVGQAHGLAFSVLCKKLPPSLKNIYKEMIADLDVNISQDGDLTYLAKQGVMLLNTVLTVKEGLAFSHAKKGWEIFTDNTISYINSLNQPIVFILWGKPAQEKMKLLNNPNHLIITSNHPSPLSAYRGFFGSKPFSKTNDFLIRNNLESIKWIK